MDSMRNVRVMVVDDEDHIRLFVKTMLASMGCQVVAEAGDGRRAIELFDSVRPDLVLLDINMPQMDGIATLRELRARSRDVVVIMLSSLASLDVVQACLDAGADYQLRKDLPLDDLRREIESTWRDHAGSPGAAP